MSGIRFLLWQL